MRTHGTLTRWNDERGFGFITPARNDGDIFVHISAFPRDGVRPRLNELISFDIETTSDGKQRAIRVMRPGQKPNSAPPPRSSRRPAANLLGGAISLLALGAVGTYGYTSYLQDRSVAEDSSATILEEIEAGADHYSCDGRRFCSEMTSCAEATYFVRHCPDTQMDGNGDGVPCESQWCN